MAITFQYNKTSLQTLNKSLKMRLMALPIIKNKESALRLEVHRRKENLYKQRQAYQTKLGSFELNDSLWAQFDFDLLVVDKIEIDIKKIAGVRIPIYRAVSFEIRDTSWINRPGWFADCILFLKEITQLQLELKILEEQLEILERERKRTTQKVNLYEKVQIPEIETGIKKIKRFLEDEDNLSKAAQKMVKSRTVASV
ncbi:MAG: hypothetical protein KDC83_11915 [Flavobacteriales bacterium]|nr:hypothetical protein [Flavobacteriales bacterium]